MKINGDIFLDKALWKYDCEFVENTKVMTVDVGFSHKYDAEDETEFDIEAWNSDELRELFCDFCEENGFEDVTVHYVIVVKRATSFDELQSDLMRKGVLSMKSIFDNRVRCNNCMKEFFENEIIYDGEEDMDFCPYCGEGGCIMDLEDDHNSMR